MSRVLLTMSGTIPTDVRERIADGTRPRPDYVEMARAMDADLLDVPEARRRAGRVGRLLERVGGAPALLAWVCFRERKRYDAVFTDGEQVGLPLAALCRLTFRRPFAHVMIVHILSAPKKVKLYKALGLGRFIDTMFVYSTWQQRFIREELGFAHDRVVFTPFTVDTTFFRPDAVTSSGERMICSAGLELRDYPTFMEAVRGLDVRVVIAAASHFSKRADTTKGVDVPPNVEVVSLDYARLRQLYADARFVVMPLFDTEFQAGITTILEAMAMERAVVCSRTVGQTDTIVDGENGIYVTPGDVAGLRAAIVALLDDPERVARIGAEARRQVTAEADVEVYAERLATATRASAARYR